MSEVQEIKRALGEIAAREERVFKELEAIKEVQLQMVRVLNEQGWMKKAQEKHENWLIELSKKINFLERELKGSVSKSNDSFHEWYIRLSISTVFAVATGIIVWVVTK